MSNEGEASVSRSEEDAELVYVMDPSHPEQTLQIETKLSAEDKVWFKDFISNNLDVFA